MSNTCKTNKDGWVETKTEVFKIKLIVNFQSVEHWVSFHKKNPNLNVQTRKKCCLCRKLWETIKTGNVWLCQMESRHVNQCICDECVKNYENLIIRKPRPL